MAECYPKRPKFFANRFVRLLTKKCVANELGSQVFTLLTVVVMQEDSRGYTDAVNWYNHQLMPLVGAASEDTLGRIREKAACAGWLNYTPGRKGVPGVYFVTVPERYQNTDDAPTDEDADEVFTRTGAETSAEQSAGGSRNLCTGAETSRGKVGGQAEGKCGTPIPIPFPSPVTSSETDSAASSEQKPPKQKTETARAKARKPRARNLVFDAIARVTGADPELHGGHIGKVAALFAKASPPVSPDEVVDFSENWRRALRWANADEHPRLTVPIVQKHMTAFRAWRKGQARAKPAGSLGFPDFDTQPPRA